MRSILLCLVLVSANANAGLIDRGGGLIYDDVLNITWLQNADLFGTGSTAQSWDDAVSLVSGLNFAGLNDWRLPTTPGTGIGFLYEGELGNLYYSTLGNVAGDTSLNTDPFFNVQNGRYWLGTESSVDSAFAFFIAEAGGNTGLQDTDLKTNGNNIWAVRDGDVLPVPEPTTLMLLGLGSGTRIYAPTTIIISALMCSFSFWR